MTSLRDDGWSSSAPKPVNDIAPEIQEYLLDHFWKYPNAILQFVHREAFVQDMEAGRGKYFSKALLYSIFACAARFSDRPEIRALAISPDESPGSPEPYLLHKATSLLEVELRNPGIPTVQCLFATSVIHSARSDHRRAWLDTGTFYRPSTGLRWLTSRRYKRPSDPPGF